MANERVEQLITDLAADVAPVVPLPPVSSRMARWLTVGIVASAAGVLVLGPRDDLWRSVSAPGVLRSVGLLACTSVGAAIVALRLSVPGVERSSWARALPLVMSALWAVLLWQSTRVTGVSTHDLLREPLHPACAALITTLALVPTWALARHVRSGFTLDAAWTAMLVALGGAALAAAATQFVCPIDRPAHLLVAHATPAAALAAAGSLVVGRLVSPIRGAGARGR